MGAIGILIAGCSRPSGRTADLSITDELSPQPSKVGLNEITVRMANSAARPVESAVIDLEADMSHPGMSPVFGHMTEIQPGVYRGQLELGMAGDWAVLLHITMPGGQKLERQFAVPGVRPN
jgi:hypothetical protein